MHADEVPTDASLVRRLLAGQFPHWAALPVEPVASFGTDNALYRVGDELVARLPRRERTAEALRKELRWLPRLASVLPLAVPLPRAEGDPAEGYPFAWAVYRWLPGEDATRGDVTDPAALGRELAQFVLALQRIHPAGGPGPGAHNVFRGEPLVRRDEPTRGAIESLGDAIDAEAATAAWDAALRAPAWDRSPLWIHGDLDARNLLLDEGALSAVIDWGCLGVGDPACDAMVAWKLPAGARDAFRAELPVDDACWARARGWALSQAVGALAYYTLETNAALVLEAQGWLAAVLADSAGRAG